MAAKEMYDYLPTISPDVSSFTLGVAPYAIVPQGLLPERGVMNQEIHTADDDSEERISFSSAPTFTVPIALETLTESEAGVLYEIYYDPDKANGIEQTFPWLYPDGHTYVARFDCDLERIRKAAGIYGFADITMRILGRIADT
jgi:hypothetical protein